MQALLNQLLQGVDFGSPWAFWQLTLNMLALVPWTAMIIYTVFTVVGGVWIAWYRRGSYWKSFLWSLVLGVVGWPLCWASNHQTHHCPHCGAGISARSRRCRSCGHALRS